MALTRCPRCGTVSDSAPGACPRCSYGGAPLLRDARGAPRARRGAPGGSRRRTRVLAALSAAALLALLALRLLPRGGEITIEVAATEARLASARIAVIDAEGFQRFRAGHIAATYEHGQALEQRAAAAAAAAEAARRACVEAAAVRGEPATPCLDGRDGASLDLAAAQRDVREFKARWFAALVAESRAGSGAAGPRATLRLPRAEPVVLVAWADVAGDEADRTWYWVGWASLEGRGEKLVRLDARNRSRAFPFRDPPGNF